ncbi:alpha-1,6-mannosyl-glycoprotein 2-beta-N-acetylglucosaminyltransferase isoform X1 [Drosophila guanche]|uniref:Alpha-1,6-mannosyl-glycoprotein 2-beta-N-acetylglucosaminyltransferase n=1 Tax=Drosophila guanche TaxID=7266 RepID=A0A3B0K5Q0_DROGU|nr:alpha-1,6-mannosyl-glycoprotein 2-beta-N-acetylglucosaminyltransferase isoform X1 [Drosophila guanche]SPP80936.1 blast:Alpha-1%2C6-mannosyl-glycoprotein 2-beta-N-acetylglucosaminyltransferase [Drosophila guanche]
MSKMRGRILIPLPNTGSMGRKRNNFYMRSIFLLALCIFGLLQYHNFNYLDSRDTVLGDAVTNDSDDAILAMVPAPLHKYLTPHSRNHSGTATTGTLGVLGAPLLLNSSSSGAATATTISFDVYHPPNISEIKRQIVKYNDMQLVLNEDTFGPLQNDSVIIVVQVHTRITYLRHLIVSLAQAQDITKVLLVFSHDYYDEDINDLVQQIDFCKVLQIFYPYSIQTHPHEYPGVDPNDCQRNIKKDQAMISNCNNALYPDLYGHYREAKFTQTKHHWIWKANRVFNELEVTRYHTGLVLFLEEDHYVAEDFLYLLAMMQKRTKDLCPQCNVLSLGTYLKTFNYYTYHSKTNKKSSASSLISSNSLLGYNRHNNNNNKNNNNNNNNNNNKLAVSSSSSSTSSAQSSTTSFRNNAKVYVGDTTADGSSNHKNINNSNKRDYNKHNNNNNNYNNNKSNNMRSNHINTVTASSAATSYDTNNEQQNSNSNNNNNNKNGAQTWNYHVLPSLYSVYQKVEVMPWVSSKHNMGFAFNRTTWTNIRKCARHFCTYDDYNWDWSLQHVSQQCLQRKLHAMIVKGPRVFHIGECGVHHKNKNCESNQVISKVQHVLRIARTSHQLFPRSLTLTVPSLSKKTKLRKGNGGWGDLRDHELCLNMTLATR